MNDTQQGRVIVNWKVTAVVMVIGQLVFGYLIGIGLLTAFGIGLLSVVLWLAFELHYWKPSAGGEL